MSSSGGATTTQTHTLELPHEIWGLGECRILSVILGRDVVGRCGKSGLDKVLIPVTSLSYPRHVRVSVVKP